uniref:Uncharacterized protein n=1 Tax=Rhizophora mucronata TaxID=61149 RepID=A0A2P2KUH2_RHIMU
MISASRLKSVDFYRSLYSLFFFDTLTTSFSLSLSV